MSYDLTLFPLIEGQDAKASLRSYLEQLEQEFDDDQSMVCDRESARRNRELAVALCALNPELKCSPIGNRDNPHSFELDAGEGGNGIQISLYSDSVAITVPYWHSGPDAARVFKEIWSYLGLLQLQSEYLIYDSQLDAILDLDKDFDKVLAVYSLVVKQISGIGASGEGLKCARKTWWKFW